MQEGDRIGKYEIESLLGEGGNGVVFAARDEVLGRRVALKVLHPQYVYDADLAGRFRAEAAAMARLNHQACVTVHDFVGDGNQWAIVMELVEGGETLATMLEREGALAPARALTLAGDVAAGLAHAHDKGIVHRDVKPANVMVVREGGREHAKVTDFGIARILEEDRRTQQNMTLGTLWYIAPEQAQDSGVDHRADIYSFGVTLYEALTGTVPFPYENAARVLSAHVAEAPAPPSKHVTGLPTEVDRVVMDCLAKRPEDRPQDGATVIRRLEEASAALASASRPIPRTRVLSEADLSSPDLPPHVAAAAGPGVDASKPSFAAPVSVEERRREDRSVALWIGLGVLLLLVGVCLLGGVLSCLTCAR